MANLSNEQILTILQNAPSLEELNSCRKHDERAKFHVEPTLEPRNLNYKSQYLGWVGNIINKKKLAVFEALLTLPIETVEFTEGVFDELTKVFEAQDRYIDYHFTNPELSADFERYLEEIGDNLFWQTKGFSAMKSAINSIVILDLPAITDPTKPDKFPRPYYYLLDVQKVKAFDVTSKFKFEYIMFVDKHDDRILYVFDDGYFRTYKRVDQSGTKPVEYGEEVTAKRRKGNKDRTPTTKVDYTLVAEVPHGLGYTPARSFWSTPFEASSRLQKRGPHTNSLGKLDWLLYLYTSTKHSELQAGFPIDVVYEQKCDYKDAAGNACEGGYIRTMVKADLQGSSFLPKLEECPGCKDNKLLGAGTLLTAPAMASTNDPDLIQGMHRIPADKNSLEYLLGRIDKYEATISTNMIGYVAEGIREAMNKEQVASMTESQRNCLAEVSDNFEAIHRWTLEGLAHLRYGKENLLSVTCNYGRKWFIHSVEKLQENFKEAKTNGVANFELSSQQEQILLTKYKNNPAMLERYRTLMAIEPYQGYTVTELMTLNDKVGLNEDLLRLKLNFSSYVARFEREFMEVASFMQYVSFDEKVAFIQDKLLEYVYEEYPEEVEETPPLPGPPAPPVPPAPVPPAA